MRTVLVAVRTAIAAQSIALCAERLGVATVRTAVSEAEVLARLADAPADLVLADSAIGRTDLVGFTRRILAAAPGAVLVYFGQEHPRLAAAAVAAGARGLIRATDQDPVTTVTKAMLLISAGARSPAGRTAPGAAAPNAAAPGAAGPRATGAGAPAPAPNAGTGTAAGAAAAAKGGPEAEARSGPPTLVPTQRSDWPAGSRRANLTERELQVLHGMAEGRSNAEIGRELYVSEDTVKTHARRLFRKLGARDRAHAVAVGFRSGMLG